jgi:protoporphyrinogen oxidase
MEKRVAVIIGGGPAGLTAAYELLARSGIRPIVLEKLDLLGGLARTENYKGNRIDIGGHRFFSKSDRVMQWWFKLLPLQELNGQPASLAYQGQSRAPTSERAGTAQEQWHPVDAEKTDRVMLVRSRKSRIYFLRKFFDYPISLSARTLKNLGLWRVARIGLSYAWTRLFPIRNEQNLEQFFINRFGRELYRTFFQSYTEKVWGVPCSEISAAWGAQRIKGLSITQAVLHVLRKPFRRSADIAQKDTQTSLIEQFLYPKLGPGQMWETAAERITHMGGQIVPHVTATRLLVEGERVVGVEATDERTGEKTIFRGDYVFSSMPVQELIRALDANVPAAVRAVSDGLVYRDFITVGLLLNRLKVCDETEPGRKLLKDNWIYIQEPDVLVGRLQIFNNWSPALVADASKVWVGLEYFCYETDALWKLSNEQMIELARQELAKIGIIEATDVLDGTVIRVPKTYPAYFGTYDRFPVLREYLDRFENLFLVGRNGMHRYNNQDHSMLTAMTAVDNILAGRTDKANIWDVNAEQYYHEEK